MNIAALLLAAGKSSRFGANKLLHPLDGRPIALHSAIALKSAFPNALAIVSPGSPVEEVLSAAGLRTVVCERAAEGMGESLKTGIAATQAADGWVVALADMPFIRPTTHMAIERALRRGAKLVAPVYQGERGHPVGISNHFLDELLAVEGDAGARHILKRHTGDIQLVSVDDAGVLKDIDTPQDLPTS